MKTWLTIICTLLSIVSLGQNGIRFDFHVTPLYGYRVINSTNPIWNEILENDLNSVEEPGYGLSLGGVIEKPVSKRLLVAMGIERTNLSEKVTRYFSRPIVGTFSENFANRYQYYGLSVATTYNAISSSRLNIGFTLSFRSDKLARYEVEPYSLRKDTSLSTWEYNKLVMGGSIAMNFEYIFSRLSVYIRPGYFQYLTPNVHYTYTDDTNIFPSPISTEIRQYNFYFFNSIGIKYILKIK